MLSYLKFFYFLALCSKLFYDKSSSQLGKQMNNERCLAKREILAFHLHRYKLKSLFVGFFFFDMYSLGLSRFSMLSSLENVWVCRALTTKLPSTCTHARKFTLGLPCYCLSSFLVCVLRMGSFRRWEAGLVCPHTPAAPQLSLFLSHPLHMAMMHTCDISEILFFLMGRVFISN